MRRHIFVDNLADSGLLGMTKNRQFVIGLLVGQITEERDYVIHYIPTPQEDVEEAEGDESDNKTKNSEEINENWIAQHAKQVTRLLPGGLDVIGIFLLAPHPKYEGKLREVLFSIYKTLSRYDAVYGQTSSFSRVVVEICTVTKKLMCRTYDVSDHKSSAETAEWKVITDRSQLRWSKLESKLTFDLNIPVTKAKASSSLLKQLNNGLAGYFEKVRQSVVFIDNKVKDKSDALFPEKKGKQRDQTPHQKKINVDILFQSDNTTKALNVETGAIIHLKGSIQVRAFVQQKVSVGYAQNAVKKDIIRSLLSRCEIHCEDCLVTDEEESDMQGVHELPRRMFAPITGTDVSLSDYVLMGEKPIDSLDVFSDILGLTPLEEDIEDDCEIAPDSGDPSLSGCSSEEDLLNEETVEKLQHNVLVPVISAVAALVAVGTYFIAFNE